MDSDFRPAAPATLPSLVDNIGSHALTQFITVAGAALDANPNVARDCILRAIALLKSRVNSADISMQSRGAPSGGLALWQSRRVSTYISANLTRTIRLRDLAALLQLSRGHFSRAFRETFGQAPMSYVMNRRIHRAQALLMSSLQPLAEIALECGMTDQSHFTRVFRRLVGMTPGAWRRQNWAPPS